MDNRSEIREFLSSRRARITPQQAGLIAYGHNRRVPGLRREEVAMLAGVSIDYYTQLERGKLSGVSDTVLDALAARSSWTRPSAPISSISPVPPAAPRVPGARPASRSGPPSSTCSMR